MPSSVELLEYARMEGQRMNAALEGNVTQAFAEEIEGIQPREAQRFAIDSAVVLMHIAQHERVQQHFYPNATEFQETIRRWLADKEHGAQHSYAVFLRMRDLHNEELALQTDETETQLPSDEELALWAILHDFGEYLPVRQYMLEQSAYEQDELKNKQWRSRHHAQLIALTISRVGRRLGADDATQLAKDVLSHDYYWRKPTPEQMERKAAKLSPSGKLLADADRLVGESAYAAIGRNRKNSLGKWYMLRDLTGDDRLAWQERTGGIFDGMSAVLPEFTGPDHWFYTLAARNRNDQKRSEFRQDLLDFYTQQYEDGWRVLWDAIAREAHIQVGLRDSKQGLVYELPNGIQLSRELSESELKAQLEKLVNTPVAGKENPNFIDPTTGEPRQFFGYSLCIDGETWLDPSILRFADAGALRQRLLSDAEQFQDVLKKTYE